MNKNFKLKLNIEIAITKLKTLNLDFLRFKCCSGFNLMMIFCIKFMIFIWYLDEYQNIIFIYL